MNLSSPDVHSPAVVWVERRLPPRIEVGVGGRVRPLVIAAAATKDAVDVATVSSSAVDAAVSTTAPALRPPVIVSVKDGRYLVVFCSTSSTSDASDSAVGSLATALSAAVSPAGALK